MRYGSVCSGIEAATVAWKPLGWKAAWYSEIEKFPSAVLKHHYPDTPNLGDMTRIHDHELFRESNIDVLVGGTPCQSFSVAGLRKGMADPRGNLALVYLSIADRTRPRWLVWENVPGVLSSNEGRDFGAFIGALGQLGYGFAYRVLDAQYFGVPQRRRRVFVVGYLGDWRRAAAVLFERQSLSGYPAPSREEGKGVAGDAKNSPRKICYEWHNQDSRIKEEQVASTLNTNADGKEGNLVQYVRNERVETEAMVAIPINTQVATRHNKLGRGTGLGIAKGGDPAYTLQSAHSHGVAIQGSVIGRSDENGPQGCGYDEDVSSTLNATDRHAVAYDMKQHHSPQQSDTVHLTTNNCSTIRGDTPLIGNMQVRRLTPTECERLQGFPDGYTQIPWRGKEAKNCPDGPRYKALGNSMAVPVMFWIGKRIEQTEKGINEKYNAMQAGELPD